MKKINYKKLLISILIPVFLSLIIGLIIKDYNDYNNLIKPFFAPPGILFPIIWTILYILMGVSAYIIYNQTKNIKDLTIYLIQLIINLFWSALFFIFKLRFLAFIWILFLIILVIIMIYQFYKISKLAAYLQFPYLIWIIFATVLNLAIFLLN